MTAAFPDPRPNELLYSIFARYTDRVGYPNLKNYMLELFGKSTTIASINFASHFSYFVTQQSNINRFTVDSLIAEHTLLPYYRPFLPQGRYEQLIRDICGNNGSGIAMRSGIMASTVPTPSHLRYCPECFVADRAQFGESYWHREHQLPGVYLCPLHTIWLKMSSVNISRRTTRHEFLSAEKVLNSPFLAQQNTTGEQLCDLLLFVTSQSMSLLKKNLSGPGLPALRDNYLRILIERDLATYSGRVHMSELQRQFKASFPDALLQYLHCFLDSMGQDNWLARLVRKPDGVQHPLQHLILMYFLGLNVEVALQPSTKWHPFGYGPWPCLNPVCEQYKKRVIISSTITYYTSMHGRPTGAFCCPSCGFHYARVGPDKDDKDIFKRGKIIQKGFLWEESLIHHWHDTSLSLRAVAKLLGIDPLTVKRHVAKLGLSSDRLNYKEPQRELMPDTSSSQISSEEVSNKTVLQRNAWLDVCESHPGFSTTELRHIIPGTYTWLYRHDKIWLQSHCSKMHRKPCGPRIDWGERDIALANAVRAAGENLRAAGTKPLQITATALGRQIGQRDLLQQHLDKLPKTRQTIDKLIESREEFAVRRIWWSVLCYIQEGYLPCEWELIRRAGVARLKSNDVIKPALQEAILYIEQKLKYES